MTQQEQELKELRDQIDSIDQQIHQLLNQRANCAQQVAEVKERHEGQRDAVFYRPEREAQVLRRVMDRNQGPLDDKVVARLFREVMSVCLALESPLKVAYLGPVGAFTQQAAEKHFGHAASTLPMNTLDQVFREVESNSANYGVVPIESASEGLAIHTLDLFERYPLKICGEVEIALHYHLLAADPYQEDAVRTIYAQQEALSQCASWLEQHYPDVHKVTVATQAEAAKAAAEQTTALAIAGDSALELFPNLQTVARNIEMGSEHRARFLILGKQQVGPSGQDKTSILVAAHNRPGALYSLLEPFHKGQISLTRIETRAVDSAEGPDSVFYIDFEGHEQDSQVLDVLAELEQQSVALKRLGSYPQAVL